ncbi:MAG: hypothetical protein CL910_20350 [Deltaproteobacteria bacterium]|jgi:hypothetical protein|nr:hypothetical protein [Deltaproteobacteria bacterium]
MGMTNEKTFLSFWGTFPGILTLGGVALVGITLVIATFSSMPTPVSSVSCAEYQQGREDFVACNANTQPGFYWSLVGKTDHYSAGGVSPVGAEPRCGQGSVSLQGMSARFPVRDATFLAVRDSYENTTTDLAPAGCNLTDAGEKVTDRDLGSICGLFSFECKEQPQ